jgi:hypothetical protein
VPSRLTHVTAPRLRGLAFLAHGLRRSRLDIVTGYRAADGQPQDRAALPWQLGFARSAVRRRRRSSLVLVPPLTTRLVWLLAGLAWAARSVMEFARPDYYEPVTLLDWSAVVSYSVAWLISAAAVLLLARDLGARPVHVFAVIFAVAATVAGLANLVEDALDQAWGGTPYIIGFLVAWIALLPLAAVVGRSGTWRVALLPMAMFIAISLFNVGGGIILLLAASAFALAPRWFLRSHAVQP